MFCDGGEPFILGKQVFGLTSFDGLLKAAGKDRASRGVIASIRRGVYILNFGRAMPVFPRRNWLFLGSDASGFQLPPVLFMTEKVFLRPGVLAAGPGRARVFVGIFLRRLGVARNISLY